MQLYRAPRRARPLFYTRAHNDHRENTSSRHITQMRRCPIVDLDHLRRNVRGYEPPKHRTSLTGTLYCVVCASKSFPL